MSRLVAGHYNAWGRLTFLRLLLAAARKRHSGRKEEAPIRRGVSKSMDVRPLHPGCFRRRESWVARRLSRVSSITSNLVAGPPRQQTTKTQK